MLLWRSPKRQMSRAQSQICVFSSVYPSQINTHCSADEFAHGHMISYMGCIWIRKAVGGNNTGCSQWSENINYNYYIFHAKNIYLHINAHMQSLCPLPHSRMRLLTLLNTQTQVNVPLCFWILSSLHCRTQHATTKILCMHDHQVEGGEVFLWKCLSSLKSKHSLLPHNALNLPEGKRN